MSRSSASASVLVTPPITTNRHLLPPLSDPAHNTFDDDDYDDDLFKAPPELSRHTRGTSFDANTRQTLPITIKCD